jgi:hypothetical protein
MLHAIVAWRNINSSETGSKVALASATMATIFKKEVMAASSCPLIETVSWFHLSSGRKSSA